MCCIMRGRAAVLGRYGVTVGQICRAMRGWVALREGGWTVVTVCRLGGEQPPPPSLRFSAEDGKLR